MNSSPRETFLFQSKSERVLNQKSWMTREKDEFIDILKIILLRPDNPRKAGTHGFRSWEIAASEPGMTVSRYKQLGGRMTDLRWDVKHNWARIDND